MLSNKKKNKYTITLAFHPEEALKNNSKERQTTWFRSTSLFSGLNPAHFPVYIIEKYSDWA